MVHLFFNDSDVEMEKPKAVEKPKVEKPKAEKPKVAEMQVDEQAFVKAGLAELGFQVARVPGDGSCLFHSLARSAGAIGWDVGDAQEMRKAVRKHIKNNPEQFIEFVLDQSWVEFLRDFKKPTTWAGHEAVLAFSDITGFGVCVYEAVEGPSLRKTTVLPTEHPEVGLGNLEGKVC